ncbi:MAG: hypothetical protein CM1200mP27_10130 [Chloroflexota bacterium]|nr:MAG: hypothetical protein CM1200mP27_10130 [Chloroflexota bacterium]
MRAWVLFHARRTQRQEWDRVMDINAKGVFLGTKAAIPEMRKAGGGSMLIYPLYRGFPPQSYVSSVYNASKGAVRIFTKSTAIQYASESIRAKFPSTQARLNSHDCFSGRRPGSDSRVHSTHSPRPERRARRRGLRGALPGIGRVIFVTGSELIIDGGYLAQ